MKSSKTQAVVATMGGTSNASVQRSFKKRRVGGSGSASSSSSSSSWGQSSGRRRPCPDFKRIKGTQPSFIVDGFQYASKALSSVYFLTHFHSDHYGGLDKVSLSRSGQAVPVVGS